MARPLHSRNPRSLPVYWHFVLDAMESATGPLTAMALVEATGLSIGAVRQVLTAAMGGGLCQCQNDSYMLLSGLPSHLRQRDWCKWVALAQYTRDYSASAASVVHCKS